MSLRLSDMKDYIIEQSQRIFVEFKSREKFIEDSTQRVSGLKDKVMIEN